MYFRKIQWLLDPPHQRALFTNLLKNSPGFTRYACTRIADMQDSFAVLFSELVQNMDEISLEAYIQTKHKYDQNYKYDQHRTFFEANWKVLDEMSLQTYIGFLL